MNDYQAALFARDLSRSIYAKTTQAAAASMQRYHDTGDMQELETLRALLESETDSYDYMIKCETELMLLIDFISSHRVA